MLKETESVKNIKISNWNLISEAVWFRFRHSKTASRTEPGLKKGHIMRPSFCAECAGMLSNATNHWDCGLDPFTYFLISASFAKSTEKSNAFGSTGLMLFWSLQNMYGLWSTYIIYAEHLTILLHGERKKKINSLVSLRYRNSFLVQSDFGYGETHKMLVSRGKTRHQSVQVLFTLLPGALVVVVTAVCYLLLETHSFVFFKLC